MKNQQDFLIMKQAVWGNDTSVSVEVQMYNSESELILFLQPPGYTATVPVELAHECIVGAGGVQSEHGLFSNL